MPGPHETRAGIALVIGVGEYRRSDRVENLQYAARDAVALADALADPALCCFPREQVVLLTNAEAGRDELVQRLSSWLPKHARGTELTVIYFAGHGMVHTVGKREEGFLVPYDADPDDVVTRGIAMSDISRWIDGLQSRAVIVCLDCCHAGKVLGQREPGRVANDRNMELRPAVIQAISGQGRYLIASCDEGQKSYECSDLGHGLFTYHLLRGIEGKADSDGDGRVGLTELFNYVSEAVSRDARERFGREQRPWTSATWAEQTYISTPNRTIVPDADPFERTWREEGVGVAILQIEGRVPEADEVWLRKALRFLGRIKEPAGIPAIFGCLGHTSEAVRSEARTSLHAIGWETVIRAVESLARRGEPARMEAILDGLNAFEAHPRVVALLDQLVVLLRGELRNRTILLLERKRLGLELDRVAAMFHEIQSPYQVQKVLGQGLFTDTYLARAEGTDLEVAVRVLRQQFADQPHVRAAFLDLSNRAVHLVHEKLALTREARAFPDRNFYFTVRDYVPGVTLQRALEAGKRFEPVPAVRVLREVAEALTPLQRQSLCHGGVKPSNIFLCEGDRVILGDPSLPVSGIGLALDRLCYDYRYTPPEMFLGGVLGPQSDFYALGCVLYELLCGRPPFVSDNFHELAAQHMNNSIIPLNQRRSPIGAKGNQIVLKLLARSPAERYGKLEEVIEALATLESEVGRWVAHSTTPPTARPLLRDASIMNYQGGQSVLNFEETGRTLSAGPGTGPSSQPANEPGQLTVPGYRLLEELGRGAMGMVYKAVDTALDRPVALKVLRAGFEASAEQMARFRTEALSVARLTHPNIVQIYGWIEHQGLRCLALEYVDGGNLAMKIRELAGNGDLMPIRDAVMLTVTLARAVEFAHQHGVLHRDLKPSNILLTAEGQPKIGDFGLAKQLNDYSNASALTFSGQVLGTPMYMAPEQADSSRGMLGPASDVYALGTIFYELLTGRQPITGSHPMEVLTRLQLDIPGSPKLLRPEIPSDLNSVCLKCLAKDPTQRYTSAAGLADDLERWLRGKPISVTPPGFWQRLVRFLPFRKAGT
jgi:serine/threonine protein kinase